MLPGLCAPSRCGASHPPRLLFAISRCFEGTGALAVTLASTSAVCVLHLLSVQLQTAAELPISGLLKFGLFSYFGAVMSY